MNKFLSELRYLQRKKKGLDKTKRDKYIRKQIHLTKKLIEQSSFDKKFVSEIHNKIYELISNKEFVLSKKKFISLLNKKSYESQIIEIFLKEYNQIKELLANLFKILEEQLNSSNFTLDETSENKIYLDIEKILLDFDNNENKINDYFNDLNKLTYKKKYIKSGMIISKIINKILFRIEINSIENIPKRGPCILAPHHYHAAFDPLILISVIDKPLFFATSVETFISIPLYDKLLYNLGCLPIKRDDKLFQNRLNNAIPEEKIRNYDSSNLASIKKMLIHLKHGDFVVIFPEGEAKIIPTYARNNDENFLDPQTGFVSMAFLAERKYNKKIPIIPIGLKYDGNIFKKIIVNIGKPIYLSNSLQKLNRQELKQNISKISYQIFDVIKQLSS